MAHDRPMTPKMPGRHEHFLNSIDMQHWKTRGNPEVLYDQLFKKKGLVTCVMRGKHIVTWDIYPFLKLDNKKISYRDTRH